MFVMNSVSSTHLSSPLNPDKVHETVGRSCQVYLCFESGKVASMVPMVNWLITRCLSLETVVVIV